MNKQPTVVLTVSHNIFLSRQERYRLIEGVPVEVDGVSIPVWFSQKQTSEPAEEIFCNYVIHNNPDEESGTVKLMTGGYRVNLPQIPRNWVPDKLSDDEWRNMNDRELSSWYRRNAEPSNARFLRDKNEGGMEFLKFKYLGEYTKEDKVLFMMHYCEIKTFELLQDSLF